MKYEHANVTVIRMHEPDVSAQVEAILRLLEGAEAGKSDETRREGDDDH